MVSLSPSARRGVLAPALAALLMLAGCEDPSGVGLELIGETGGQPVRTEVAAPGVAVVDTFTAFTGGVVTTSATFARTQSTVLAGAAVDPLLGPVTASAYIDFTLPTESLPGGFLTGTLESVDLVLTPAFKYGDTLRTVSFEVYDLSEGFTSSEATADSTYDDSGLVLSFDVAPGDTLIDVPFSQAFVDANRETIQSVEFTTEDFGFRISPASSGLVLGFDASQSALRVVVDGDTVFYPPLQVFTNLTRPDPTLAGRTVLLEGRGNRFEFTFDLDAIPNAPVAAAELRIRPDLAALEDPAFFRPTADVLTLFAVSTSDPADPTYVQIGTVRLDEDLGLYTVTSAALTALTQDLVLGTAEVSGFALGFSSNPLELGAVVLDTSTGIPVELSITYVPAE